MDGNQQKHSDNFDTHKITTNVAEQPTSRTVFETKSTYETTLNNAMELSVNQEYARLRPDFSQFSLLPIPQKRRRLPV